MKRLVLLLSALFAPLLLLQAQDALPFDSLSSKPTFQGQDAAFFSRWVAERVSYPQEAIDCEMQGRIMLRFIIAKDGSIEEVSVLRNSTRSLLEKHVLSLDKNRLDQSGYKLRPSSKEFARAQKAMEAEVMRVIKSSPRWEPGMLDGQAVRVAFTFPFIFRLQ